MQPPIQFPRTRFLFSIPDYGGRDILLGGTRVRVTASVEELVSRPDYTVSQLHLLSASLTGLRIRPGDLPLSAGIVLIWWQVFVLNAKSNTARVCVPSPRWI